MGVPLEASMVAHPCQLSLRLTLPFRGYEKLPGTGDVLSNTTLLSDSQESWHEGIWSDVKCSYRWPSPLESYNHGIQQACTNQLSDSDSHWTNSSLTRAPAGCLLMKAKGIGFMASLHHKFKETQAITTTQQGNVEWLENSYATILNCLWWQ